jgi:hypothetical protein
MECPVLFVLLIFTKQGKKRSYYDDLFFFYNKMNFLVKCDSVIISVVLYLQSHSLKLIGGHIIMKSIQKLFFQSSILLIILVFSNPSSATPAEKKLEKITKKYASTKSRFTKGVAGKSRVGYGYSAWLSIFNDVHYFKRTFCKKGKKDSTCTKVKSLMNSAAKDAAAFFKACMNHPKFDWWDMVDSLVKIQNRAPYLAEMKNINTWMKKIGAGKSAYWKGEIKKAGNWSKYVKANNVLCYASSSKKMKKIKYAYGVKDKKMFIRCVMKKSRSKFKGKQKNDYFRVYVLPGAYYSHNEIKAKVKWKGNKGTYEFPLKAVRAKLAAKSNHVGPWVYVRVDLHTAWIRGKGWVYKGGKRVWADIWNNAKLTSAKVLVQLR